MYEWLHRQSWTLLGFCGSGAACTCNLCAVHVGCDDGGSPDSGVGDQCLEPAQCIEEAIAVVVDGRVDSKALAFTASHMVRRLPAIVKSALRKNTILARHHASRMKLMYTTGVIQVSNKTGLPLLLTNRHLGICWDLPVHSSITP